MRTVDAVVVLTPEVVERVIELIRADTALGAETSSWSEVAPTAWEAMERVRALVEEGQVVIAAPTPEAILTALRAFEPTFWRLEGGS
jgi:hypothetical protein